MDLYQYFVTQSGRNIIKNAHYFPIYERHFQKYCGHPVTFFEIGTGEGGSSRMWKHYFGPAARIVTIDIEDRRFVDEPQIHHRTGNQADPAFLRSLVGEFGPPDVVIDDGSHMMEHINRSFDVLFPTMTGGGTYLVEDLDGAYWPERGGGLHEPSSFIERCKGIIDEMNYEYVPGGADPTVYGKDVVSISFYQMIVVLERLPSLNRKMMRLPTPFS